MHPVYRPKPRHEALLECVLLDTSASTLGDQAQARARAAVTAVAEQAYRARRQLGVLAFGGQRTDWLITPQRAPRDIADVLAQETAGGGTPLRAALLMAWKQLTSAQRETPGLSIRSWLITDGRSRDVIDDLRWPWELIVVDSETARVPLGRARRLADTLSGRYVSIAQLAEARS